MCIIIIIIKLYLFLKDKNEKDYWGFSDRKPYDFTSGGSFRRLHVVEAVLVVKVWLVKGVEELWTMYQCHMSRWSVLALD
jgi:hypothetical protein